MGKSLVLVEKPSVAKDLAQILGATEQHQTYYEGPSYIVTWAYGHLLTLKMPEDLKPEWRQWQMDQLPMIPKQIGIKPLPKTRNQLKAIGKLARRNDVSDGIIATDSGRAGELLARWILEWVQFEKPVKRLWISSQTKKAVMDGFNHLKPAKDYDHLYQSELARSQADWLVGLNVTRALTLKYDDNLNSGRVQTPTLNLVNQAQLKSEEFVPTAYFEIELDYQGHYGRLQLKNPFSLSSRDQAQQVVKDLSNQLAQITTVAVKQKKVPAPLPYDLTEIQREANAKYQYSAKKTLSLIQSLYETHKVVSYPRTDSRYLTSDLEDTMTERLRCVASFNSDAKQLTTVQQRAVFNDQKVTDHYALIPTEQRPRFEKMSSDETKIYRMIVERFLMLFAQPKISEIVKANIQVGKHQFKIQTERIVQAGWQFDVKAEQQRLILHEGASFTPRFIINQKMTKAPKLITEGELLAQMNQFNLGTPATRAEIIEKLVRTEMMERRGSILSVTPKGRQLLQLVNPSLVSPELTAKWEQSLEQIATGRLTAADFISSIETDTRQLVSEVKQANIKYHDYSLTTKICPKCGNHLRERNTRDGKIYVCSNPECDYRRRKDPKVANHRCPQCHRKMEIIDGKNGTFFRCKYDGTTEKMMDKKARKKKMSKHETKQLMKKINQDDEPVESPLAAALKQFYDK